MMDTSEKNLARLLDDSLDAELGPRRTPPAFRPPVVLPGQDDRRVVRRWLMPLAAAAAVAAVTAGIVAGVRSGHEGAPADPGPASSSAPAVPSPTGSAGPTPSVSPSTSRNPSTSASPTHVTSAFAPAPSFHSVDLRRAGSTTRVAVALPNGWVARNLTQYTSPGRLAGSPIVPGFCLTPSAMPATTAADGCPLYLYFAQTGLQAPPLSVDTPGGFAANSEYCVNTSNPDALKDYGDRTFGGRGADYRRWEYVCPGHDYRIEQYVVATDPGFVLFSDHADTQVAAAMGVVVAHSVLPTQDRPVRLEDFGIIRSAVTRSDGVHVSLDRLVVSPKGFINLNPATYDYIVHGPQSTRARLTVGATVTLTGDGTVMTEVG